MKIGLYTIPHTGTNFVMQYFALLGFRPGTIVAPETYVHRHAGHKKPNWDHFANFPCIITARDPYLCALRFIHNGQTIDDCAKCWDDFLSSYESLNYTILDIGTRPSNRHNQLLSIATFVNKDPIRYATQIQEYANSWLPVKSTSSELKRQYLETGSLPTSFDWSPLNRAVAWYNSLETNDY